MDIDDTKEVIMRLNFMLFILLTSILFVLATPILVKLNVLSVNAWMYIAFAATMGNIAAFSGIYIASKYLNHIFNEVLNQDLRGYEYDNVPSIN